MSMQEIEDRIAADGAAVGAVLDAGDLTIDQLTEIAQLGARYEAIGRDLAHRANRKARELMGLA